MEFCKECDSIMFIKCKYETLEEGDDEEIETKVKLDKSELVYNCKICGFTKPTTKKDRCLYTNDYSKDLLSNKIVTNPYICLDPTLPILNNIKCPNSECLVNKGDEFFKNKLILNNVLFNLNNKITDHIKILISSLDLALIEDDTAELPDNSFSLTKLSTSIYLNFASNVSKEKISSIKKKLIDDDMLETYDIEVSKLNKLKNRVTYIKYDNVKMKFMYICCHCNNYWKR